MMWSVLSHYKHQVWVKKVLISTGDKDMGTAGGMVNMLINTMNTAYWIEGVIENTVFTWTAIIDYSLPYGR